MIDINSKKYPELLKEIPDAPLCLNYRGVFDENIFKNTLAVVGSRRATSYGKRIIDEIVWQVARKGVTVVSGFMYGIDAAAHRTALKAEGKTVAVMPCGVDVVHPAYQKELYKEIEKTGLILSELEDGHPPDKWTYPRRNRIVVGLSKATLVVEAEEKSGSLISANLALKYKRKLFAVPGPIFNSTSYGTNMLIKKGLAESVTCVEDVLSFFSKEIEEKQKEKKNNLTNEEKKILNILEREQAEVDVIAKELNIPIARLNASLSILSLKGIIKKEGRSYRAAQ